MPLLFPAHIETPRLILRPLHADDITERYLSWFRDAVIVRYLEARAITRAEAIAHLEEGIASGTYFVYAIIEMASGLHIGNIKLGPISARHRTSDLVTIIGEPLAMGRGFGSEAIAAMTQAGFEQCGLRKFSASAYRSNVASIKAYRAAGWLIEAILYADLTLDGRAEDRVLLACFNPAEYAALPEFPLSPALPSLGYVTLATRTGRRCPLRSRSHKTRSASARRRPKDRHRMAL